MTNFEDFSVKGKWQKVALSNPITAWGCLKSLLFWMDTQLKQRLVPSTLIGTREERIVGKFRGIKTMPRIITYALKLSLIPLIP